MAVKNKGRKVFMLKRRVYVYTATICFIAVLVLIGLFSIKGASELSFYYMPSEGAAVVAAGNRVHNINIPGNSIARVRYCSGKTSGAVLMSNGSSYSLYSVEQRASHLIADNSTSNYVVAHNGDSVAYIAADSFLYTYDVSANKSKKIDENVSSVAVSPNGKSLLYTKMLDNVNKLYVCINGKSTFLADGYTPLAVSDGAKYIYVLSADNTLCIIDKTGAVKGELCKACDTTMFCFSGNMEQVVFCDGKYTYISSQGKSRIRLTAGKSVPAYTAANATLCNSAGNVYTHTKTDLSGMVYISADGVENYSLYFIDKNFLRTDISSGVAEYKITNIGAVYRKSNGDVVSYINGANTTVAKGATSMCATGDGRYIYYASGNNLFVNHRQEAVLIADGLLKMYMAENNTLYFIMTDNKLYSVKNADQGQLVDENVYSCKCTADSVYYSKNYSTNTGAFELYGSEGSGKFRFLASELTKI